MALDREAARLLGLDERTPRRYRAGAFIPGPVRVALAALAADASSHREGRTFKSWLLP